MEWKSFAKKKSELWLPSMMWCAPHLLLWDAWSDRERNWKAKWVLPNLATFTGHFSSELACRALARAEYQPQPQPAVPAVFARFQECPAFGDHCKLVSWPSRTPSPGIVHLTWCLSVPSLPQHPQYYQPSHNRTNWPGEEAELQPRLVYSKSKLGPFGCLEPCLYDISLLPPDIGRAVSSQGYRVAGLSWRIRQADTGVSPDTREERGERQHLTCPLQSPSFRPASLRKRGRGRGGV